MKKFYSSVTYYLLSALLFGSLFAPIPSDLSMKIPAIANPVPCRASTISTILPGSNDTVEKANFLAMDTLYEDTVNTGTTHYYCLVGPENTGYVCITLTANEIPSLSFQLFDSAGTARSPSSYQYEPTDRTLQIKYFFSADENYLLAISNLLSQSITYTVRYTDLNMNRNQDKKNISKSKKSKTASKPKVTATQKKSSRSKVTPRPKATPKPKVTVKAKKTSKTKTSIRKLTLSKTFLRISAGGLFSLKANIHPKNSRSTCQWIVSDSSILGEKRSRNTSTGSILTAKGQKKGTVIITCKSIGKRPLSASCTVKIV